MIRLAVLGSTGSIGTNTLDVVRRNREHFRVVSLAAGANLSLLFAQAAEFGASYIACGDSKAEPHLKEMAFNVSGEIPFHFGCGELAVEQAATLPDVDVVVGAISGFAGFRSVIAAIKARKHVALANKETLVAGGEFVMDLAREHQVMIVPIDSEHSSLFQCLQGQSARGKARELILTASGGPFLRTPIEDFWGITPEQAVKHPRWSMGKKISVDSATMMNKGLEVIEAARLFAANPDEIKVIVHPQSLVHGFVNYADGTSIAAISASDMRVPISYALRYLYEKTIGDAVNCGIDFAIDSGVSPLDFGQIASLDFMQPDFQKFPALGLCYEALRRGGNYPAVLSAANEIAVQEFLDSNLPFPNISKVVSEVLDDTELSMISCYEDVLEADRWGRSRALQALAALK